MLKTDTRTRAERNADPTRIFSLAWWWKYGIPSARDPLAKKKEMKNGKKVNK